MDLALILALFICHAKKYGFYSIGSGVRLPGCLFYFFCVGEESDIVLSLLER